MSCKKNVTKINNDFFLESGWVLNPPLLYSVWKDDVETDFKPVSTLSGPVEKITKFLFRAWVLPWLLLSSG